MLMQFSQRTMNVVLIVVGVLIGIYLVYSLLLLFRTAGKEILNFIFTLIYYGALSFFLLQIIFQFVMIHPQTGVTLKYDLLQLPWTDYFLSSRELLEKYTSDVSDQILFYWNSYKRKD